MACRTSAAARSDGAGEVGGLGGVPEQPVPREREVVGAVGQRDDALVVPQRLVEGERLRRLTGRRVGRQPTARRLAGGQPVVGDAAVEAVPAVGEGGVGGQRLGQARGARGPARRAAATRPPSRAAAHAGRRTRRRRARARAGRSRGRVRRRGPRPTVPIARASSRCSTRRPTAAAARTIRRVAGGSDSTRASSRSRTVTGTTSASPEGHELLGEERVALGPGVDLVQPGRGGRDADDPAQLECLFVPGERPQLDAVRPGRRQLGEEAGHGVLAVGLVGARGEHEDRARRQPPREQTQQVAGRPVRPVHVLHEHEEGTPGREAGEQGAERRVQAAGARLGDVGVAGVVGVRQEAGQLAARRRRRARGPRRRPPGRRGRRGCRRTARRGARPSRPRRTRRPAPRRPARSSAAHGPAGSSRGPPRRRRPHTRCRRRGRPRERAAVPAAPRPARSGRGWRHGSGRPRRPLSAAAPPRDSAWRSARQMPSCTGVSSSASSPCASRCTRVAVSASGASTRQKTLPEPSSNQY